MVMVSVLYIVYQLLLTSGHFHKKYNVLSFDSRIIFISSSYFTNKGKFDFFQGHFHLKLKARSYVNAQYILDDK